MVCFIVLWRLVRPILSFGGISLQQHVLLLYLNVCLMPYMVGLVTVQLVGLRLLSLGCMVLILFEIPQILCGLFSLGLG